MAKKVCVILSGCGVFDGSEIYESTLIFLALDRAGAQVTAAAPNIPQYHHVDHLTGQADKRKARNVLTESARLARGNIEDLAGLDPAQFDAVALPGGFGAAKNLCNFAHEKAEELEVEPITANFLMKAHELGKPIAFACIAPAICARLFGDRGVQFTIGNDHDTAEALSKYGGKHVDCEVEEILVDNDLRIVTTPAYMLAERISQAETGLTRMVDKLLQLT